MEQLLPMGDQSWGSLAGEEGTEQASPPAFLLGQRCMGSSLLFIIFF